MFFRLPGLVLRCLFLSFAIQAVQPLSGQQDSYWYFGKKAALDFRNAGGNTPPEVLFNSVMTTTEASATISDNDGNLLFYTNGVQVFNRLHRVMANGDGLAGDPSSCQIAVVPQPGNSRFYYIFTTDAFENDFLGGYYYSIVDINGDGGLGDVVSKNVPLWPSCSERITAIRHANGTDVWVITNDQDADIFRAWLITCDGLQPGPPVVSVLGEKMNLNPLMNVGVLKASPDGKFVCQTHFPFADAFSQVPQFAQFFDFDNETGRLSNARKISFPGAQYNHCEFSPDSRLLYLTRKNNRMLDQLEITLPTLTDILNSRIEIPTVNPFYDIQLAADEKIYLTESGGFLAVIPFPNIKGNGCGFRRNAVSLLPGTSYIGLPSHINDIVGSAGQGNGFGYSILDSCTGKLQFLSSPVMPGPVSWLWEFGDNSTSTEQNPVHIFNDPSRVYTVKLTLSSAAACGTVVRSRQILPAGVSKPRADFSSSFVCDSGFVRFINSSTGLNQPGIRFSWDFGDGDSSELSDPLHIYPVSGSYMVKMKLHTGNTCLDDSVSKPVTVSRFEFQLTPDQAIQGGQSIRLTASEAADQYLWSPGLWLSDSTVRNPLASPEESITYILKARKDGCSATDSVHITVIHNDFLHMPTAFTPNGDGRNDEIYPLINGRYRLVSFTVYNRFGQAVFHTAEKEKGWDGKTGGMEQDTGVYVWVLKVIQPDGVSRTEKGLLSLIR